MKLKITLVLMMLAAKPLYAADAARLMPELTWEKRVLLVFAPAANHPERQRQRALLDAVEGGLHERDMTVIEAFADDRLAIDGQPQAATGASFYRRFAVASDEFRVVLVGKDGSVKLERNHAVASGDLFALIDSMPMRRHEMLQDD
ncbi:MAG: DUF4174 domain-containing protein [Gammaproteobacteria bacterium]|nr:DUF4174 domain-containing protein [Gammaproteobacteria bacterium]